MKKGLTLLLCVATIVMFTFAVSANNGAPSGAHFNLNLISVQHEKNMVDSSGGRVIFVLQDDAVEITMSKTKEFNFMVRDKDGTDGFAEFQIPVPGTEVMNEVFDEVTGITELIGTGYVIDEYLLYARPLGKPSDTLEEMKDSLNIIGANLNQERLIELIEEKLSTQYPDGYTFEISNVSSTVEVGGLVEFKRGKGKSEFNDITSQMMYITVTAVADITVYNEYGVFVKTLPGQIFVFDRVYVFDELFINVFWKYDNKGLKLLQLRFYYTTVPEKTNNGKRK